MRSACLVIIACLPASAAFRAAAAKVDITPQDPQWLMGYQARRSTGVLDRIYHRVLALEAGAQSFVLVATDLCLFSPGYYDEVARDLERETGIRPVQFWWTVTHTHAAPEVGPPGMYKALLGRSDHEWNREYATFVKDALIRAVKEARGKLEPARIAFGEGRSMANINRRARDVDGTISLGLNPEAPVDRQIGLMRLERPDGSPIALVANYPMHGTVMNGQNLQISGDGPGTVTAYVEQKLGVPVLYVNGAAGNIAPIYTVYPDPRSGHLSQFRVLLGDRILAAVSAMGRGTDDVTILIGETRVATPRKEGLIWPEELAGYSSESLVRLPVRYVRINNTLIWAAGVELFCEIALEVRRQSPFSHTFYFGYANGWFGYLPTAAAFGEGGYEPRTSPFTPQAESDLLQSVISLMQGMR